MACSFPYQLGKDLLLLDRRKTWYECKFCACTVCLQRRKCGSQACSTSRMAVCPWSGSISWIWGFLYENSPILFIYLEIMLPSGYWLGMAQPPNFCLYFWLLLGLMWWAFAHCFKWRESYAPPFVHLLFKSASAYSEDTVSERCLASVTNRLTHKIALGPSRTEHPPCQSKFHRVKCVAGH